MTRLKGNFEKRINYSKKKIIFRRINSIFEIEK
jgi:hypothetical protein